MYNRTEYSNTAKGIQGQNIVATRQLVGKNRVAPYTFVLQYIVALWKVVGLNIL